MIFVHVVLLMCYVTITKIVVNDAYISFDIAMETCVQWQVISMVHIMYKYTYTHA